MFFDSQFRLETTDHQQPQGIDPSLTNSMARSEEAIRRRALKRHRTEEEQRKADRLDMLRQQEGTTESARPPHPSSDSEKRDYSAPAKKPRIIGKERSNPNHNCDDPMKEPGAWICPKCQNSNFASRRYCNSNTCDEPRPSQNGAPVSAIRQKPRPTATTAGERTWLQQQQLRRPRHDEATSKKLVWDKQADSKRLLNNQELRKRFVETGGEGMMEEDAERAKILIARDERRKAKRSKKAVPGTSSETESPATPSTDNNKNIATSESETEKKKLSDTETMAETKKKKKDKGSNAKAKRDQNNSLRRLYLETGGKGMKAEQVERAKLLIARDERKRQKQDANK